MLEKSQLSLILHKFAQLSLILEKSHNKALNRLNKRNKA